MEAKRQQSQEEMDAAWYLRELMSDECLCGVRDKYPKRSFCYRCYSALPRDLRDGLYRRIGGGYEEAFEEAHKYLTENVWK